ncbi:MAG: imidazole glycerol phosphate synthase subunit HisH [Desulfovibrio sp.]|nr:imidazole glycerol phosphate synthase subunit HisH [Desulfovibrio sp.]
MLAILDYGAGNLTSVARAFSALDIPVRITANANEIAAASGIVFPGVGQAGQAMTALRQTGLDKCLAEAVARKQPLLGICLGCQILVASSEEGPTDTLGLLDGVCRRFDPSLREEDGRVINIPHMGWNGLRLKRQTPLFEGIDPASEFYFVHGYYVEPAPELVIATTVYGREFCSAYGRDGLWALQFHPEKSGRAGLKILENFNNWCQSHAFQKADCLS